jgi:hypothetical protein
LPSESFRGHFCAFVAFAATRIVGAACEKNENR